MGDPLLRNCVMNRKLLVITLAIILLVVGACWLTKGRGRGTAPSPDPHSGPEMYPPRVVRNLIVKNYQVTGENETVYDRVPQRVLAVGENINETLVALGAEDKVICPVRYGNPYYVPEPEYAERYNRIRFQKDPILNPETVLALSPDLIVSGQSLFTEKRLKSTEFWNNRGIHTFLPRNANRPALRTQRETLEKEYDFILGLGIIFNKEAKARKLVEDMERTIDSVRIQSQGRLKPKVLIIEQLGKNLITYDDTKLAGDICTRLGAVVPNSPSGTIGIEYLLQEDPDIIFVVKSGGDPEEAADYFRNMRSLQTLKAVRNKRVAGIALNYTYNSAIKTGAAIKKFAKGIYPDLKV